MKQLAKIIVGNYTFDATADVGGDGIILVHVSSGKDTMARKMNHMGPHDHPAAQFEKDVIRFATNVAIELAGKIRSRELAKAFIGS